jgi:hypothetical protein
LVFKKTFLNLDHKELLGELQLAFVCFFIAENYAGFVQWKNIVQLICSCQEAIEKYVDTLFTDFLGTYILYFLCVCRNLIVNLFIIFYRRVKIST